MFQVNGPPSPPPFEDDLRFLAGSNNLERGLNREDDDRRDTSAPGRGAAAFGFEPRLDPEPAPRPDAPRVGRPLLDLFPSVSADERPPAPLHGTALPPRLPRSPVRPETLPGPQLDQRSYEAFYGLTEKPFDLSSDPKFFYPSTSHGRALHEMLDAIHRREGIVVLTGGLGLGKTTLCRMVARELDRRTVTSIVLEPFESVDELLKIVLIDFGVISRDDFAHAPDVSRDVLMAALGSFLESLVSLQANAVVMIDEAQTLPPAVLAEIPAAFPAAHGSFPVQLVLVGQPALRSVLKRAELEPLAGHLDLRLELGPLADDEITGYVTHRLSVVGSSARVDFSKTAFVRIYELSRGVPGLVNLLCDRALWHGSQTSASVIDAGLIDVAAQDVDLATPVGDRRLIVRGVLTAITLIALTLVGAAGAAWVFRDEAARVFLQWLNVPQPPGGPVRLLPAPLAPIMPPEAA
jgi:type II secretory pathway predicted ATPase ExeA